MARVFFLMWLSDIAGSIACVGWVTLIALGLCVVIGIPLAAVAFEEGDGALVKRAFGWIRWLLLPLAIAVITPNKDTVRLLAVSSAADAAVSTALGQKGMQALNAILDRVIAEAQKK